MPANDHAPPYQGFTWRPAHANTRGAGRHVLRCVGWGRARSGTFKVTNNMEKLERPDDLELDEWRDVEDGGLLPRCGINRRDNQLRRRRCPSAQHNRVSSRSLASLLMWSTTKEKHMHTAFFRPLEIRRFLPGIGENGRS